MSHGLGFGAGLEEQGGSERSDRGTWEGELGIWSCGGGGGRAWGFSLV